ncbi:MAG TPA: hypothetical protein VIJ82_08970 [Streptosporangiaceae bacterium]
MSSAQKELLSSVLLIGAMAGALAAGRDRGRPAQSQDGAKVVVDLAI